MQDIQSLNFEALKEYLVNIGEKKFRAEQIFYELHNGKSLDEMSNIPQTLKDALKATFCDTPIQIVKVQKSADGTQKLLYKLQDDNVIEGVIMSYKFGYTLCVSTQVGCRMGCKFCASGLDGVVRNLTAGEIMSQIIMSNRLLEGDVKNRKINNVVLMGSGEPLDNYDNVLSFVEIATDKHGLYYSERNISLSTCGLVPNIYKLADSGHQIHLCISLHASNDLVRRSIMPIAKAYKIDDILSACKYYFEKTNRRILIEYIMIKNVNSSKEMALELAKKISKLNCMVNLIGLNEVKENSFKRCSKEEMSAFAEVLKSYKINVTTRRSLGNDIDGACGQLRRKYISTNQPIQDV